MSSRSTRQRARYGAARGGEPRSRAAALSYHPAQDAAPRVVAKGEGHLAERIIALAREHRVPIHHDPTVVRALLEVEIDGLVPPELYLAVAQVLTFLYRAQAGLAEVDRRR